MCTVIEKLFLWLVCGSCISKGFSDVYFFEPPMLDIEEAYIDKEANSTFQINCKGKNPVYWKVPENGVANDSRLSIVESSHDLRSFKEYKSQLILQELHYTDTGSYTCYYGGTTDFSLKDNVTSLYVFVNDPDNLFLENYHGMRGHMLVVLQQQQKGLIPCLPTNSKANVTLWKTEGEDELVPLGQDITFNPTQGFHIFYPTLYFSGIFQCRATLNRKYQQINLTLYCLPITDHDPQPFIDATEALYPIINATFTLKCYVSIDLGTQVLFYWRHPQKNNPRINETVVSVQKESRGYIYQDIISYLTVKDAQPEDSGIYTCSVTDHNWRTGKTEETVLIYSPQHPSHVNFTTDIDISQPVVHKAGQDIRFVISVSAFPSMNETELYWEKNGELLASDGHCHIKKLANSVILEITQISHSDAGVYTLFGKTRDMMDRISITLRVEDKPIIILKNTSKLYMLGQKYEINCSAEGYPTPEVWWRWKPCKEVKDCKVEEPEAWRDIEYNDTIPNVEHIEWKTFDDSSYSLSNMHLIANHSSYYQCFASNRMGIVNVTTPFIVTDASEGFEISILPNRKPIDGDHVTLVCKVNILDFSHIEWHWRSMLLDDDLKQLENSSDVSVHMESSVYSHSSFVEFKPIRVNFSGDYECMAFHEGTNKTSSKHITIDVRGIQKPVINKTNMIGVTNFAPLESLQEFYCYATGVPLPEIMWLKNGETIGVSSVSGVELTEHRRRLTIKHVVEDDAGLYECIVQNRGGKVKASAVLEILIGDKQPMHNGQTSVIIIVVVFVVFGIALFVLTFFFVKRKLEDRKQKKELNFINQNCFERGYVDIFNPNLPLEDQIDLLPYKHRYEFPKERLKLGKTLGQGAFGRVVKAEAIGLVDGEATTTVAVKMLKETADNEQRKALIAELKILIHLGRHLNIVNLLGAVTKSLCKGELMVIVEYCCHGNLRHYLLKHKEFYIDQLDPITGKFGTNKTALSVSSPISLKANAVTYANILGIAVDNPTYVEHSLQYAELDHHLNDSGTGTSVITGRTGNSTCDNYFRNSTSDNYFRDIPSSAPTSSSSDCCCDEEKSENHFVTTCDLLCFAFQCARGMDYLISRKLIHRDLAARNVLLATNNVVKICDFGLAKDCYKYSNYIKKSDGLLPIKWMAIESIRDRVFTSKSDVWSFGVLLWEIFTLGGNPYPGTEINEEFFKKLKNGYRMEKPDLAPDSIYHLMKSCWFDDPSQRPDFNILADKIGSLLEAGVREYYIELNEPYQVMNEELINNNDYLQMNGTASVDYTVMCKPENDPNDLQLGVNFSSSPENPHNTYDNITNIRSIGNGPVPKVPMEIVPMIQLSPSWSADLNPQNDFKEHLPDDDSQSSWITGNAVSGYLSMNCSNRTDSHGSEDDDDCVFLKNLQPAELPHYVNGDYTSVPLLQENVCA